MLGFQLRQHIVEFLPGIGVVTDGAVDATSPNGPWNWTVPQSILGRPSIDACNGGCGGQGGALFSAGDISLGGGGGGSGGYALLGYEVLVAMPGEVWTIAAGAAGAGGAAGAQGGGSGTTSITIPGATAGDLTRNLPLPTSTTNPPLPTASSTTFGTGGTGLSPGGGVSGGAGGSSAAAAGAGGTWSQVFANFGAYIGSGGGGGGAGASTGTAAGGAGGSGGASLALGMPGVGSYGGQTDGTVSYGSGGSGGQTPFGTPGEGGKGPTASLPAVAAGNATGYGGGGGGGAGNNPGGNGSPGMLRIIYWSMD